MAVMDTLLETAIVEKPVRITLDKAGSKFAIGGFL
jgi:hypothetical protein